MAGCRHGPEMGTHRGDGRWTAPAGGHTRSVSSLGSPGAVPGVVWAFERFSTGASDAARFALFQTKPGNPEEFFRLPAKELSDKGKSNPVVYGTHMIYCTRMV